MVMKNIFRFSLSYIIVISILLGTASGIIASVWIMSSLSDYAFEMNQFSHTVRSDENRPKAFPNSYADATNKFLETSTQSTAMFFLKSSKGLFGYSADASIGVGVILTSDGWIALASPLLPISVEQTFVQIKDQLFDVTRVVTDPITNVIFVKVQANNLSVVGFGTAFDLALGEQMFVVARPDAFVATSIFEHVWPQAMVVSSDIPTRRINVSSSAIKPGQIAFDLSGDLLGFMVKNDKITSLLPLEDVLPALRSLLEKKDISRPSLGVQYLDLSHSIGLPEVMTRGYNAGAYLTGHPAIRKGSAAALAQLKEGDIILSVNGQNIDATHGLDEWIVSFKIGETVLFVIDRGGQKQTINVVLGEYGK